MDTVATITPGDTLAMTCSLDIDGTPHDLAGITIRSQIRTTLLKLLAEFQVTKLQDHVGALTLFELRADPAITAAWPVGPAVVDTAGDPSCHHSLSCLRRPHQRRRERHKSRPEWMGDEGEGRRIPRVGGIGGVGLPVAARGCQHA